MRITHDVAFFDVAILLEETRDFLLAEPRMYARHEQVRARVARRVVVLRAWLWRRAATKLSAPNMLVRSMTRGTEGVSDRLSERSRPFGEALRALMSPSSRRSARGERLRSRS